MVSSDRRLWELTLWLGATRGEGLPKPAAQCMHLGLPREEHQDAAYKENPASHLASLLLQGAPTEKLGEPGGAKIQGNRDWVGGNKLP